MTAKTTATARKSAKKKTVARKSGKTVKTSKLTASQKHTAHVKHEAHLAHEAHLKAVGKAPKMALARARHALPVCAFEAVAMSLRLAGQRVHDDEVAELWWLAGADGDGASIEATLDAAVRSGLAGCRPLSVAGVAPFPGTSVGRTALPADVRISEDVPLGHALILGIVRPFPHAVLATPDGWWSWGELHDPADFPSAVVEEAWAVSWS